ncbi:MAG: helix-turn-helix domain-containing protein [Bacillota bacterium]|jgi:DNA-directed RNA polymerase specialized sigma subunit
MSKNPDCMLDLLDKAQEGDIKSTEKLLLMFQPLIKKWSAKVSLSNIKDIEQELNYTLIKAIRSF